MACGVALVATTVASAWRVLIDRYVPQSDWALIEIQTRAVGTSATPLTGAWSRFGWNHPGPLLFYALALPYRIFGGQPEGIQVGVVLINTAFLVTLVLVLRRHGIAVLIVATLGLLAVQLGLLPNHLRNEWNAAVPVLGFVLLLVAAWDSWDGPRWIVALIPLLATFLAQTHIAYVALGIPALVLWALGVWTRRSDRRVLRAALWSSGIAALLWAPALVAVLGDKQGNLRHCVAWLRGGGETPAGWRFAARLIGTTTSLQFPFARGLRTSFGVLDVHSIGVAPGIALALLAGLTIVWRNDPQVLRASALLGSTWIVGFIAVAGLTGPRYPHLVWWLLPLSMLTWIIVTVLIYRLVAAWMPKSAMVFAVVGLCLVVPATFYAARRNTRSYAEFGGTGDAVVRLSEAAKLKLGSRHEFVLARTGDYLDKGSIQAGMMAYLDRHGVRALVPSPTSRPNPLQFPANRVSHSDRGKVVMLISGREALLDPPGDLVASADPLNSAERHAWLADYRTLAEILTRNGRGDLVKQLGSSDVGLALLGGPSQLSTARGSIERLQRWNRRGPVDLLWLTQPR